MKKRDRKIRTVEKIIDAMGSVTSLIVHTLIFSSFFLSAYFGFVSFDSMFLILTTLVSLEAIYLSLFIQMTVNENTKSLREVEDDIEEIQEDVEELGEDLEDIQEDLDEISEDIDEIQEDVEEMSEEDKEEERREQASADSLDRLTSDVKRILADIEALKKGK